MTEPIGETPADGLASAISLVGQRWALLIVDRLLDGPKRFGDLQKALPRIPSNILTARLKELQESGLVSRVPLAHNALAYAATPRGHELGEAIEMLRRWGAGQSATAETVTGATAEKAQSA